MNIVRRLRSSSGPGSGSGPIDVATATDVGRRVENQDRSAVSAGWGVVSDGVGGHTGGALAAELTVGAVLEVLDGAGERFDATVAAHAIGRAGEAVRLARRADAEVAGMAATLTLAAARTVRPGGSTWIVVNVGDSPAWRVTGEGAQLVTVEHTVTAELVRTGALPPEALADHPQRHIVTRAIGMEPAPAGDFTTVELAPGDWLVLASDGLSDVMGAEAVAEVVLASSGADGAARALVAAALERGTHDNVTVAVLRHRPA